LCLQLEHLFRGQCPFIFLSRHVGRGPVPADEPRWKWVSVGE
jgi:hypothetical protein